MFGLIIRLYFSPSVSGPSKVARVKFYAFERRYHRYFTGSVSVVNRVVN